ncbi:hypothetical protein [Nocardioides dongkuii]|uniref:hypothetical protein n=1 Tax=Nocardioides dongkuii TaxID=2760089 RepID=UPI0015FC1A95|nr:hypothetical protein [Nocardioides dongkuii]
MSDQDADRLGTALHDRVRDERPDLDRLVAGAARAGSRIRRRRRAGASLAAVVGVATVALLGSQLTGGSSGTAGGGPGFAGQPSASTTPTPSTGPLSLRADLQVRPQDLTAMENAEDGRPQTPVPVRVDAPGWRCGPPADEKLACESGSAVVTVTVRPASNRASYLDPAKADVVPGVPTFVSDVHGRFFATVAPGPGATQAQVDAVGAGLVWD